MATAKTAAGLRVFDEQEACSLRVLVVNLNDGSDLRKNSHAETLTGRREHWEKITW
jgi:hypothetical protein